MVSPDSKMIAIISGLDDESAKSYKKELLAALEASTLEQEITALLGEIPPSVIAAWITKEQNATAAAVLCLAQPQTSGNIFKLVPKERQVELCLSINNLSGIDDIAIESLFNELKKIRDGHTLNNHSVGGVESLAKLLEAIPVTERDALLLKLSEKDQTLASTIKQQLLSLEKICSFTTKDLSRVCRNLSDRDLVLAFKLEKNHVCEKFLASVSQGRAEALRDLLISIGPVSRSDAEAAQQKIQEIVTKLHQSGSIAFPWDDTYV
jgi:flagellar motor switch protein FliG